MTGLDGPSRRPIMTARVSQALMAHDDNTPFWIPVGTNKDDLE